MNKMTRGMIAVVTAIGTMVSFSHNSVVAQAPSEKMCIPLIQNPLLKYDEKNSNNEIAAFAYQTTMLQDTVAGKAPALSGAESKNTKASALPSVEPQNTIASVLPSAEPQSTQAPALSSAEPQSTIAPVLSGAEPKNTPVSALSSAEPQNTLATVASGSTVATSQPSSTPSAKTAQSKKEKKLQKKRRIQKKKKLAAAKKKKQRAIACGAMVKGASDRRVLERIVEAEAGGESMKGKILVANVILNRVKSGQFPDTVKGVVFAHSGKCYQFSPIADGRYYDVNISKETQAAVKKAMNGEDESKGALYFMERSYADSSNVTWFDTALTKLFRYGCHEFYK